MVEGYMVEDLDTACGEVLVVRWSYDPSIHLMSFRARSAKSATLFMNKPPRPFTPDVTHNTGVTFTFWTPYVSFVFITRIRCKRNNKCYIPL